MDVTITCPCPPKADGTPRHETDTVTLRDRLDFRTRLTLRQTMKWVSTTVDGATDGEILAALTEAYLVHCIEAWTLVDAKGKAYPASRANIHAFLDEHDNQASIVAEAADELYTDVVLLPLLVRASTSSAITPTPEPPENGSSTSAKTTGGTTPPKQSRQSSTTTTPMVVTGPMPSSPAGVSN